MYDILPIWHVQRLAYGLNDILDEFKNGCGCFKNIATRGRGIFPNIAKYGFSETLLTL